MRTDQFELHISAVATLLGMLPESTSQRINIQDPGLPSTYYDESHIGGLYWGAPFAGHDQATMVFIDPALSNSRFQIRDTSAQEVWHFESLKDDNQLDKWMTKA